MAMGGGHKGNGNGSGGNSSSSGGRGKPYGLMLLLAFGVALLGVMTLHKLRERRIFSLLVQDKTRQLISLHLLLQKEREHTKEAKKKAEERKAKIFSLRNQKMELDRRLSEMQSTIDSLKDEQKTMESELEDRLNEIKLLRNKDMITATLKQKEAEIEDLKHRLKSWSTVSTSNPPANETVMGSMEQKGKTELKHEEGGRVHESLPYNGVVINTTKVHDGNGTTSNFPETGKLQKPESLGETAGNEGANGGMRNESPKHTGISGMVGKKTTERNGDNDEQEKENSFSTTQLGKLKNLHQGESQNIRETHTGGKKLEIDEISRLPGRKWRFLARNGLQPKAVGVETMRSRSFSKDYKDFVRSREEGAVSDQRKAEAKETEAANGEVSGNIMSHSEDKKV